MSWLRKALSRHAWLDDDAPIVTERLAVVRVTKSFDQSYLALLDGEFRSTHHWPKSHVARIRRYLRAGSGVRGMVTRNVALIVRHEVPEQAIGFISIGQDPANLHGSHQIGVQLGRDHRSKGYMTEALTAVVDHLLRADALHNVVIATSRSNAAMVRICEGLDLPMGLSPYRHPDGTEELVAVYQAIQ